MSGETKPNTDTQPEMADKMKHLAAGMIGEWSSSSDNFEPAFEETPESD